MRDGTKLAVDLYRPTRNGVVASEKLPVVWMHTPYNRRAIAAASGGDLSRLRVAAREHGYNVAVVDFRGVYASFGRTRPTTAASGSTRRAWTPTT